MGTRIVKQKLADQIRGDTFRAILFKFKQVVDGEEVAIDLTGATARMKIKRNSKTGTTFKSLSTGNGLTIIDAAAGSLRIDEIPVIDFDPGEYWYDIELTFPSGLIRTWVEGYFFVLTDVTN